MRSQVQTQLTNHVAAMAPAALIGLACGLLAIAFTAINLKVARLRLALLQVRWSAAQCWAAVWALGCAGAGTKALGCGRGAVFAQGSSWAAAGVLGPGQLVDTVLSTCMTCCAAA